MKLYQQIPIKDCGEALMPLPQNAFAFETPHPYQKLGAPYQEVSPYQKLGAPYQEVSPYQLRQGVLEALQQAQQQLQEKQPHWQIKIFDAYRPLAVQQFMVDYTFQMLCQQRKNESDRAIAKQVAQFWAQPSHNPNTPPPHSTGAAVDITLVNEKGETLDLGGEIDELSPRSYPNYYQDATVISEQRYHQRRELLREIMLSAGFRQHPQEWWHFSLGDQMWAWLKRQEQFNTDIIAYYGRVEKC